MGLIVFFLSFFGGSRELWAHGIAQSDHQAMLEGGNLRYLWLGATHMLTGYDHLLFLFGVIFFLTGFRDILKFITAFTVGHSLTLVLGTLFHLSANYYLVDAAIALSVCYKGFDNLDGFRKYLKMDPPNLLAAVFIFGLIHGFGLSTRLQELPLGKEGLLMRILSFNVGIEVGQVLALTVLASGIAAWRRSQSFTSWAIFANTFLVGAGALLFLMQMHSYTHARNPDAFGFSEEGHLRAHEYMDLLKSDSLTDPEGDPFADPPATFDSSHLDPAKTRR